MNYREFGPLGLGRQLVTEDFFEEAVHDRVKALLGKTVPVFL
jgi:hypothetical protein